MRGPDPLNNETILSRVRKLLAKAEAEGVTPPEAEALTAKAAEQTLATIQGTRRHTLKLWLLIGLASFAVLLTIGGIASALSPAKGTPKAT